MQRLDEKIWMPISIGAIFHSIRTGKISNASTFVKSTYAGVEYVAATNRNNGCLYFLKESDELKKKIQTGNCIGFIKDGDGAAGYAIYKKENFVSTVNVLYGYANWVNEFTGLFFVAAQDMIEHKYGHGYKRNREHLAGDKVMLPVTDSGEPDYEYMAEYTKQKRGAMLAKYFAYIEKHIAELGVPVEIPSLNEKDWKEFPLNDIFTVGAGKRLETRNKIPGTRPFIGATDHGNGVTGFVGNDNSSKDSNVLGVNYDGAPCVAFYHPYECLFTDSVKRLHFRHYEDNKFILLFFVSIFAQQRSKYGYGYKFKEQRMLRQKLMIPVNDSGEPDYEYMEQYSKNLMLRKYRQYLTFLKRNEQNAQNHKIDSV